MNSCGIFILKLAFPLSLSIFDSHFSPPSLPFPSLFLFLPLALALALFSPLFSCFNHKVIVATLDVVAVPILICLNETSLQKGSETYFRHILNILIGQKLLSLLLRYSRETHLLNQH